MIGGIFHAQLARQIRAAVGCAGNSLLMGGSSGLGLCSQNGTLQGQLCVSRCFFIEALHLSPFFSFLVFSTEDFALLLP